MRRWQSHKIVEADEITDIVNTMATKAIVTEGASAMEAERHEVPDNFFGRGTPQIGDYLVRYDGGQETEYLSWSPKAAFESGYSLVDDKAEINWKANRPWLEGSDISETSDEVSRAVERLSSIDPPGRDKLVRFLVARIAKFEEGYDSTDAARMEELSWLLLQAVGGQIL